MGRVRTVWGICGYGAMGKDHWSTFAYLESVWVDNKGVLDNRRMRCHPRLHRELVGLSYGQMQDGSAYPTLLKYGEQLQNHDDWSCVEDMVAAGLVRAWFGRKNDGAFGCNVAKVELTTLGISIASQLRTHKANGGKFSNFVADTKQNSVMSVEAG